MDTWATSSLTPQIAGGWERDPDLWQRVFPMDLCTHAHDIIRTWLFSRVVRAHFENHTVPWSHAMISGFVLDPDRKKMSKSKGNVSTPSDILAQYGTDAIRWRAAIGAARAGLAVRRDPMKVGRRLAMKVLNASKFVLGNVGAVAPDPAAVIRAGRPCPPRAARRGRRARPPRPSTPTTTRPRWRSPEKFFWEFCDDYLELVKERAYDESGRRRDRVGPGDPRPGAPRPARLLAPFVPFVTEEVWSWWQSGSMHRAAVAGRRRAR